MPDICAILNVFKRPEMLQIQIQSLLSQSVKPKRILVWINGGPSLNVRGSPVPVHFHHASENIGVWGRFSLPLLYEHQHYALFDDDTVPGNAWFENCLTVFAHERALLGTIGVRFKSDRYEDHYRVGWHRPNDLTTPVDIVGHAWFFDREMIETFWGERQISRSPLAGEDIHFSYSIQKRLALRTLVPPHPLSNPKVWGATPAFSLKVGTDENATSKVSVWQTHLES